MIKELESLSNSGFGNETVYVLGDWYFGCEPEWEPESGFVYEKSYFMNTPKGFENNYGSGKSIDKFVMLMRNRA